MENNLTNLCDNCKHNEMCVVPIRAYEANINACPVVKGEPIWEPLKYQFVVTECAHYEPVDRCEAE